MSPDASGEMAMGRWRLILGRFSQDGLGGAGMDGDMKRMDVALDYLYGREYRGRGMRDPDGSMRPGTLDASQLTLPDWLREVRDLFPQETVEVIERHALDRYGMTELVTDPEVLEKMEPNEDLLRALLTFKHMMKGEVLEMARRIIRRVVEDLKRRLSDQVRPVLWGKLNRFNHSPLKVAQNLDWRRTLRANLKHYDPARGQILPERFFFFSRVQRHLPWHVILAIDESGSMLDSVIHSAVMAGILAGLPALKVSLVVFDTAVVDLSGQVDDPAEALMSMQLGGGTDIAGALTYCETLIDHPARTVLIVVTDFCEGGPPLRLVTTVKRIREGGARVLGLAALDPQAKPSYDRQMADRLVLAGAEVAALTPLQLAEWLMRVIR